MYYGASPLIFERAKELRRNMTLQELKVWQFLNKKAVYGLRFKAQHPIQNYIVDFYCHALKLVIEVDGGFHKILENKERDLGREEDLKLLGLKIIRFTNEEVDRDFKSVRQTILDTCWESYSNKRNRSG